MVREAAHSGEDLIDRLQLLCERQDSAAVEVAHELKGLTKTVGAEELGALADQAEELAQLANWFDLEVLLEDLRGAHERFAEAVAHLGE